MEDSNVCSDIASWQRVLLYESGTVQARPEYHIMDGGSNTLQQGPTHVPKRLKNLRGVQQTRPGALSPPRFCEASTNLR